MTSTDRVELVFILVASAGHIVSILLIDRDERLSITILPMKSAILNFSNCGTNHSNIPSSRIRFIHLPDHEPNPSLDPRKNFTSMIENNKQQVKEIVSKLSHKLAGIVLDMMCTPMIDVANELRAPSYLYYAAGAAFLDLHDEQGKEPTEFDELALPSMTNPLPVPKSLPSPLLYKEGIQTVLNMARKFRETKGIVINTFTELERYAVNSLAADNRIPPVYPVGPLLKLKRNGHNEGSNIFVCEDLCLEFKDYSNHKFNDVEIGNDSSGLEPPEIENIVAIKCCEDEFVKLEILEVINDKKQNFKVRKKTKIYIEEKSLEFYDLFDLSTTKKRRCFAKKMKRKREWRGFKIGSPTECSDHQEVLPDGFLDRTADVGRVIGWAPQVEVLGHPSIGGFVSHCGEYGMHGDPIGAWPLYAEQKFNAFELVELGLAVEIRLDYRSSDQHHKAVIVDAGDIERGIRSLMDRSKEERMKLLNEMRDYSKKALQESGSSYSTIGRLIEDIIGANNH
ncbi:hypothetical protein Tsubulata_046776 [Turnera subulata]|uniref:Uncharacterized protein n=1 Tax=Turnera subulata TaxID=218843 RepID=A0A9Q0JE59_9ROSI|nr:hypothetical protein Tsubulata_046776 [Turnera subulata]